MLRSTLALPLLLALTLLPTPAGGSVQSEGHRLRGGILLEHMEGLKTHLKGVMTSLQSADRAKALEHVAEMQRLVLLAKLQSPPNLGEQPEEKRAAHADAFRKDLARVLGELAAMEIEIVDGEKEKAAARVTGRLLELRESAHAAYQLGG